LTGLSLTDDQITSETIGMIGAMDSYQLPDAKGYGSALRVLTGDTDELRQKRRDEVLGATIKDFHVLGEMLGSIKTSGTVVVVGGEDALKKAQADGLDMELTNVI
jgi:presequence protease